MILLLRNILFSYHFGKKNWQHIFQSWILFRELRSSKESFDGQESGVREVKVQGEWTSSLLLVFHNWNLNAISLMNLHLHLSHFPINWFFISITFLYHVDIVLIFNSNFYPSHSSITGTVLILVLMTCDSSLHFFTTPQKFNCFPSFRPIPAHI